MKELKDNDVWTAIITPLLDTGHVDYPSLEKLLKIQDKEQIGIVLLGSTGEALNLSEEERRKILDFTLSLNLNSNLIVGVGGIHEETTLEWVTYLNDKNIDGLLLVTPLYSKPGAIGQYQWFKKLMDNTKHKCMIYNVPSRTGMPLSKEALAKLVDHPNFFAVKEASGSLEEFKDYKKICRNHPVYSGDDALTPIFMENGGAGIVSVASNVWPAQTKMLCSKVKNGNLSKEELCLWQDATNALFVASNPIPAKVLLFENETITSPLLKPPLTHLDMNQLATVKKYDQLMKEFK